MKINFPTSDELVKDVRKIIVQALGIFFGAYLSFYLIPPRPVVQKPSPESVSVSNSGLLPADTVLQIVSQDQSVPLSLNNSSPYAHVVSSDGKAFVSINDLPKGQTVELQSKNPIKVNVIGSDTASTLGFAYNAFKPSPANAWFKAEMNPSGLEWNTAEKKDSLRA